VPRRLITRANESVSVAVGRGQSHMGAMYAKESMNETLRRQVCDERIYLTKLVPPMIRTES
jgi:hypothetical protein